MYCGGIAFRYLEASFSSSFTTLQTVWSQENMLVKNALAAVGNSYEITLIYMAFAFGCNMGCSVIAAQFFGAKNYRKMKTTVYTTFL